MATKQLYDAEVRVGKGRCAIAAKRIASGTCVLLTDAFAWVSVSSCNWCLQSASQKPLRRCGGCKRVKYCSRACQQLDWQRGAHASECDAFRQIPDSVRGEAVQTVLLVTRLAAKLCLQTSAIDEPQRQLGDEVLQLRHHYEDHTEKKLFEYREMAQLVLLLLTRSKFNAAPYKKRTFGELSELLMEKIVLLFCRVNCNAFTISNDVCAPLGIGVFPRGALFNHSCVPNCVVSFKNQQMVVRTIADVRQGEELMISYVELLDSTSKRRQALRESYFFDCQCQRCASVPFGECTDDLYLDGYACKNSSCQPHGVVGKHDGDADNFSPRCKKCGSERTFLKTKQLDEECEIIECKLQQQPNLAAADKWRLYQRVQTILVEELGLHPRSTRIATLCREIGTFLVDTPASEFPADKKPAEAIQYFTQELEATAWILPTMKLPSRGLLHFQLGKLICDAESSSEPGTRSDTVEAIEKAIKHLQQALSILSCAYGPENEIVGAVQSHLDEAMLIHQLLR